jgi:hypothetical protein
MATARADAAWHSHRDAEEARQQLEDKVRSARHALWACATKPADSEADITQALKNVGVDTTCGACMEIAFTGVTLTSHICEKRQL